MFAVYWHQVAFGLIYSHAATKRCKTKLLMGLAHDRIVSLADEFIKRGYITRDEYENLHDYLYLPYAANKGNGTAKKAMKQVEQLPMHDYPHA